MSVATATHLTENETKVVQAAHDGKIKFSDGVKAESQVWENDLLAVLHDDLLLATASAKRVVNSMIKKELVIRLETEESDDGNMLELTDLFIDAVHDLDAGEDHEPDIVDEDADLIIEDDEDEDEKPTTMVQAAAKKAKNKAQNKKLKDAAIADGQASRRTSHATCDHATQGSEGKKARAKCRKDRAAAEAAKGKK